MINRSTLTAADAYFLDVAANISAQRRERNRAANRCINDTNDGTHGQATHGVRCFRCYLVHRHGAVKANAMTEGRKS